MAAGHRALLLLAVASAEEVKPTSLTPVADSPLGSFEGDWPAAAPVGAPIGITMTEPKLELTTEPGAAGEGTPASGASSLGAAAHVGAVAARQAYTRFHDLQ